MVGNMRLCLLLPGKYCSNQFCLRCHDSCLPIIGFRRQFLRTLRGSSVASCVISFVAWNRVCLPHKLGGFGNQHLDIVQGAYLMKYLDKYFNGTNCL